MKKETLDRNKEENRKRLRVRLKAMQIFRKGDEAIETEINKLEKECKKKSRPDRAEEARQILDIIDELCENRSEKTNEGDFSIE